VEAGLKLIPINNMANLSFNYGFPDEFNPDHCSPEIHHQINVEISTRWNNDRVTEYTQV
jgi:hypothetical protein